MGNGKKNRWYKHGFFALLGLFVLGMWFGSSSLSVTEDAGSAPLTVTSDLTTASGQCAAGVEDATINVVGFDRLQRGTSVVTSTRISVNDGTFRTSVTTASPGSGLDVLLINDTDYHNTYIENLKIPCDAGVYDIDLNTDGYMGMYENATVTQNIFSNGGDLLFNVASNGGGSVNQSITTGDTLNLAVRFDGEDRAATQDMRCVLESTNRTEADKLILTGLGSKEVVGANTPSFYTLAGANSETWIYDIDSIEGATSPTGVLQIKSASGFDLSVGRVTADCFTKDWFLDASTGKVLFDIQDSDGARQSMQNYRFTVQLT